MSNDVRQTMQPERWQRINQIFDAVFEQPPEQRAEFLKSACGGDAVLLGEIESLIAYSATAPEDRVRLIVPEVMSGFIENTDDQLLGQSFGAYRIVRRIGAGGMGIVYEAERADEQIHKRVAIKVIKPGLDHAAIERRFLAEREILAGLEHANIARLFDAGYTKDGRPYFVMEFVDGVPITSYCDRQQLSIAARLQLFVAVCEAVNYAHRHLVIHCDLKPGNILVTSQGEVKLLDFGVARLLSPETGGTENTLRSLVTVLLTPAYSSPEQIRGERLTTASDVYSLGIILYELLAQRRPYEVTDLSWGQLCQKILEQEFERPSLSLRRGSEGDKRWRQLTGDLDEIVMTSLRKEAAERYASPARLADDIRRHLDGQPVLARKPSAVYRLRKFVKRNQIAVAAAAVACITLVAGAGVAIWQGQRAERRFAEVRHLANTFLFDFEQSIRPLAGSTTARQLVVKTALVYLESLSREAKGDHDLTRELAAAYRKIGDIQGDPMGANIGDTAGSLRSYRKSLELLQSIGDQRSKNPRILRGYITAALGMARAQSWNSDLPASYETGRQALELADRLLAWEPSDLDSLTTNAVAHQHMAELLPRKGEFGPALEHALRSVELMKRVTAARPSERPVLAQSLSLTGAIHERRRELDKATAYFRECLSIYESLRRAEPQNALYSRNVMISSSRLSSVLRDLKNRTPEQLSEAVSLSRQAFETAQAASAAEPSNMRALSDLMATASRYASTLDDAKQMDEALRISRLAVRAADEHVQRDPNDREALFNRAIVHSRLGGYLGDQGLKEEAIRERRLADADYDRLVAVTPEDRRIRYGQIWNLKVLGRYMLEAKQKDEAGRLCRRGVEIAERFIKTGSEDKVFREELNSLRRCAASADDASPGTSRSRPK